MPNPIGALTQQPGIASQMPSLTGEAEVKPKFGMLSDYFAKLKKPA